MFWQDLGRWQVTDIMTQEDGSNCSIFSFDVTANKSRLPMARNAVKKLRTLRHPGVIKVQDTVEVGNVGSIYMRPSYEYLCRPKRTYTLPQRGSFR
jgi:hypothetical protein